MSLQTRVTGILTKPAAEWRTIAGESTDVAALLRDYAAAPAAIPAVCQFIGGTLTGVPGFFRTYRTGFISALAGATVAWVMAVVGAWIAAIVIAKLAPTFQSTGSTVQALKLVVYSMTPVWVLGVLYLIPPLGVLVILGVIYSMYMFYLCIPVLVHTPPTQVIPYMVVSA